MASDNKTEKATPRRQQKAREQGQVARSRELGSVIGATLLLIVLAWQAQLVPEFWHSLLRISLDRGVTAGAGFGVIALKITGIAALLAAVPLMVLCWVICLGASLAQGGLVIAPNALAPNVSRLSPANKLRQLFSVQSAFAMLKSLVPVSCIAYFLAAILARDWQLFGHSGNAAFGSFTALLFSRLFELSWKCGLALTIWACFDYFMERRKLDRDLRMSHQDIREEIKETEGNPAIKVRLRRLQRQLRRRRMLQDVAKASVVITNPTEFAVALAYDSEYAAPVVVAKGRSLLAQQIRQTALWHEVPLVENRPLAHALYRAVEVGQMIPPKLYTAVAEVLAFIYRAQARAAGN
ncbi:MAG TPA: EscU/YscU/HrcU family type III secretion system export apparatus switch protein [Terriglobales bacterium]|nr:EscU/YscU/HrcU family type III secretion system export apparatus switch protein [Terriglobales bacterium]